MFQDVKPYPENTFEHKKVNICDAPDYNIIQYFKECLEFIGCNKKVFVHCSAGASRSPTIVIAYLIWRNKMTLNDAFNLVKEKRPIIQPNPGFLQQLKQFEILLKDKEYDLSKINFQEIKPEKPSDSCEIY